MIERWNDRGGDLHPASAPDFLPRERLEALMLQRLRATLRHADERVAPWRERLRARGLAPEDVRSLDDLRHLPFMEKADLRDHYPFGLCAVPMRDIVRLHASSGTTGKPIVVAYTADDLAVWREVMVRSFAACGLGPQDIIQNAYGYGLFTGGLGAHAGAEALGATVIPISGGNSERQILVLKDFGVTAICSTPSYFIHLIEKMAEMGVRPADLRLKAGVFGAEPWSEDMRAHIQRAAGIRAYDIYGLSEIIGPGVACECAAQAGPHIFEDHFLPEIVDPATGAVLPDGVEGELVLTTLSKQAMPVIRYRTHDITRLDATPCACGRTLRRIRRIGRRSDDMLIVRGVNCYPSQIETAILRVDGVTPHYLIVLTREHGLDEVEVRVELPPGQASDRVRVLEDLRSRLTASIEAVTGLRACVRLVEPGAIERSQGKAKRVLDLREAKGRP